MPTTTETPPPKAYILIHHSPIFPAHHSLFIPIRGNSYSGFQHEILESYTPSSYTGKQSIILLGTFDSKYINTHSNLEDCNSTTNLNPETHPETTIPETDPEDSNSALNQEPDPEINPETTNPDLLLSPNPTNTFINLALQTPAPPKSLNTIEIQDTDNSQTIIPKKKRVQLKNCQTWMREYVDLLIKEGVLGAGAREVLDGAARN